MSDTIRRIWWVVGSVAALVLVVGVWLVVQARREAERAPPPALVQAKPQRAPRSTLDDAPTRPEPVRADISPAALEPRSGAQVVEVCGVGAVRLSSAAAAEDNDQQLDDTVSQAPVPWQAMQSSSDERIRAAGLALGEDIEGLVKLAATTRDPAVYAMAQGACRRITDAAAQSSAAPKAWCETLGADQLAALEPDNTLAWLDAAAEAEARRDNAAADEALRRAAAATAVRHHTFATVAQVERYAVQAARSSAAVAAAGAPSSASAAALWVHRAAADAALYVPLTSPALCDGPGRREACLRVAERLLAQPHAASDLALGLSLGRQVGIDEAVLERHRREMQAVQAMEDEQLSQLANSQERYGCSALGQQRERLRKAHEAGEWRALRDAAVARAGSMEALMQRHAATPTTEPAQTTTPAR